LYESSDKAEALYRNYSFPVAEEYSDNRLLELPVHPPISFKEMDKVYEAVLNVVKKLENS